MQTETVPPVDLVEERPVPDQPQNSVQLDQTSDPYLDLEIPQTLNTVLRSLGYAFEDQIVEYPETPWNPPVETEVRIDSLQGVPVLRPRALTPSSGGLLTKSDIHKAIAKHDGRGSWAKPATTRRYRGSKRGQSGPQTLRWSYHCPPRCYAGHEASRLDDLPWHTRVTFTAPDWATFGRWWGDAQILDKLDALSRRLGSQAFYVMSIAIGPSSGRIHVHMVIGGSTRDRVHEICDRWPGRYLFQSCDHPWKAIHYCLAQTTIPGLPGETKAEYWYRVRQDHRDDVFSYCDGLLQPPITSDNLDLLVELRRRQIARTRKQRMTPAQRRARARLGGLAKAAKARAAAAM